MNSGDDAGAGPNAPEAAPAQEGARPWWRSPWTWAAGAGLIVLIGMGTWLLLTHNEKKIVTVTGTTTTSSTSEAPTTSRATTTTTTLVPTKVTTGPTYPSALGRNLIPWEKVGAGWTVVLYNPCSGPGGKEDPVYYLVDPDGTRYEITTVPFGFGLPSYELAAGCLTKGGGAQISGLVLDWAPAGAVALLSTGCCDEVNVHLLDVRTGGVTKVGGNLNQYGGACGSGLTRPTGQQLIVCNEQNTHGFLTRYDREGHPRLVLAHVGDLPSWLYQPDGVRLVVGTPLRLIRNDGTVVRQLASLPGYDCVAVRWWDPATVLVRCYSHATATSPAASRTALGLVPLDGRAAHFLTPPTTACSTESCRYRNAWRVGTVTVLQRYEDRGPQSLDVLHDDGSISPFTIAGATGGVGGVGEHGGRLLVVHDGELVSVDATGGNPRVLVPRVGSAQGVANASFAE